MSRDMRATWHRFSVLRTLIPKGRCPQHACTAVCSVALRLQPGHVCGWTVLTDARRFRLWCGHALQDLRHASPATVSRGSFLHLRCGCVGDRLSEEGEENGSHGFPLCFLRDYLIGIIVLGQISPRRVCCTLSTGSVSLTLWSR